MQPRLVQVEPIEAVDEVWLLARDGREPDLARVAGAHAIRVDRTPISIYVPGCNVDGGSIELADGGRAAVLLAPDALRPFDELHAALRELAPIVEPAQFVTRTHAWHLDDAGAVTATPIARWTDAVPVTQAAWILGKGDDLADHELAVSLAPDKHAARAGLVRALMATGRWDDAEVACVAALGLEAAVHEHHADRARLGIIELRRGRFTDAIAAFEAADSEAHRGAASLGFAEALIRGGRAAEAWPLLMYRRGGLERPGLYPDAAFDALGRAVDARALRRIAKR